VKVKQTVIVYQTDVGDSVYISTYALQLNARVSFTQ